MSADPAVWLRAADEAKRCSPHDLVVWILADHLRAAAGEVTRLRAGVVALHHGLLDEGVSTEQYDAALSDLFDMVPELRALLAGAGDAEGGEHDALGKPIATRTVRMRTTFKGYGKPLIVPEDFDV